MGFFIGVLAIVLVLLMILAMAMAEWANLDPGDLLSKFFPKRQPAPQPAGSAVPAREQQPARMSAKSRPAPAKAGRKASSPPRAKTKTSKRKAK